MITGIGLDVTEIDRIESALKRTTRFAKRILTQYEHERFSHLSKRRQIEFLAGRFAAKEAYSKATGTGIGRECSFQDIEIRSNELGKPYLYFKEKKVKGFVSITHTKQFAAAQVVLVE
ncbi:MAG: holo-ACP synthase [Paenisporosarcina sp.]